MSDSQAIDAIVDAFESAWDNNPPVDLCDFLNSHRREARLELIMVDLERRYRSKRGTLTDELGHQPRIEDYVRLMDRSGYSISVPQELIAEEYRVRTIWGDRPSHSHMVQRFDSTPPAELLSTLQRVDAELHIEQPDAQRPATQLDPRAPLPYEDFDILEWIGSGAIGKVYRCRQRSLGRLVALKCLHKKLLSADWAVDSFLREGQILARLNHPNILRVHGSGRFPNGGYFLSTEWVDGMNLRQWLENNLEADVDPNGDSRETRRVLSGIVDAVDHAHAKGIVHCDLKPENVLIAGDRVVVADFGMASFINSNAHDKLPSGKAIGGTTRYLAPEAVNGVVTTATDVYAIGLIFGEIANAVGENRLPPRIVRLASDSTSVNRDVRPTIQQYRDALSEQHS